MLCTDHCQDYNFLLECVCLQTQMGISQNNDALIWKLKKKLGVVITKNVPFPRMPEFKPAILKIVYFY